MGIIFRRVHNAYRAHWRSHDNRYPQKLVLTTEQADDLLCCQLCGQAAFPGATPPRRDVFNDRPIEISETTTGEIVAVDGTATPLSDYDSLP